MPDSVEPRAKMRITRGQLEELPVSRSLRVEESWRASMATESSTGVVGRPAARLAAARMLRNFMFAVGLGLVWGRDELLVAMNGWRLDEDGRNYEI